MNTVQYSLKIYTSGASDGKKNKMKTDVLMAFTAVSVNSVKKMKWYICQVTQSAKMFLRYSYLCS